MNIHLIWGLLFFIFLSICASPGQTDNEADETRSIFSYANNRPPAPQHHMTWKCMGCTILATVLRASYFATKSQDCLAAIVAKVCKLFSIENSQVCDSISTQYKDEVLYVVGELLLNPRQFCGFMIQNCSDAYNPLNNNWTIPLPKAPSNFKEHVPIKKSNEPTPTLRVLQLSDIHYDPRYAVGSEADCSYPLCCRNRSNESGPVKKPAEKFGSIGRCDIPLPLLESLFQHLKDNETFDYIVWTGDIPPHDVWNQTKADQLEHYEFLVNMLFKYFPNKLVFSTVGNHESAPADSFPPHFNTLPRKYSISWLYDALADHWTRWLPKSKRAMIRNKASYMVVLYPGLRLISMNTNYCMATNFWLYLNDTDPDGGLAWLVEQLYEAEKVGDKVHIIGHAPSGDLNCLPIWSANYYRIINRFQKTVVAQFFGHTHADQFAVFYEDGDFRKKATNILYVSPSATTYDAYMPAYRIYTIDGNHSQSTWSVLDYETHYANLTEANQKGYVEWKLEYKAKETYGMTDLSPDSWNQLINRLLANETLTQLFLKHFYRSTDYQCDRNCTLDILCQLRSARSHDPNLCSDFPSTHKKSFFEKIILNPNSINNIDSLISIPFVPKECLPRSAKQMRLLLNRENFDRSPNCVQIESECHSQQCGQICDDVVAAHLRLGQPSQLNACREAVCHISSDCCNSVH